MKREEVVALSAPKAVGPYSLAIKTDNLLFTSGQIPLDPATGKLVDGGIEAQTQQVLLNLKAVIEAAGSDLSLVVKVTIFLCDMSQFAKVNEIYARYFGQAKPARSTVGVQSLPLGAMIEMEAIALLS
jgi:2-iminobutanoate/2-iminopropanoate deaminase